MQSEDSKSLVTVSGRKLVMSMFLLAVVSTSVLWHYWDMHMMPFMPLQRTLAAEFEDSSPRVDGGQRKMHKGTPMILRVVMRVPFDPTATDIETQNLLEQRLQKTQQLALADSGLPKYDLLEIHLFNENKEQTIRQKTFLKELHETSPPVPAANETLVE